MKHDTKSTIDLVLNALGEFTEKFRHPDLDAFETSGLYDLNPRDPAPCGFSVETTWPNVYPNAESAGVYLIFSKALELLYVGKASGNSCIGRRLYGYFRENADGSCKFLHDGWCQPPKFLMTVGVPETSRFEATALEEFLITELDPSDNLVAKSRRA